MVNFTDNMGIYKEVGEKSFKRISSLGQIHLNAWQKLAQKQMEIFSLATEAGISSLKSLGDKPDFQQLSSKQAEITKQLGEEINSKNQELLELTTELRDEYIAFTEEQISGINFNFTKPNS
ncbi:phasin family protein [Thalassomonas viridans]|uniref:Phasin family protein n=1 Tax=Thalassomonas viridans TaxID=137584 RepID=A0AAE9Z8B8_9GAMM|nr:phasin family protein [Thalassomonas viridans]WDE07148.1 phasin family protein [Thalassomonas viridans]